jgi:hypothetical protein
MKVCKVEDFEGDKIECRNCKKRSEVFNVCRYLWKEVLQNETYVTCQYSCPETGCRDDCPFIPCDDVHNDLIYFSNMNDYNEGTIKFIRACEATNE